MIQLKKLQVRLDNFDLGDIDLHLKKGEYFVLLGPTGAGKTVLLETITGFHAPNKGTIKINGFDVASFSPEKRNIGYLSQDLALFPHLSVKDNILFGVRAQNIPLPEAQKRLKELSELLDIANLLDRDDIRTLSGGEKQRVAVARSLIVKPVVLLLDEPCSSLDDIVKNQVLMKLKEINHLLKVTILHVTHNRDEAFMLADRLGIIFNGKIDQVGKWLDLYRNPASLAVARFLFGKNIFEGKILKVFKPKNASKKAIELQVDNLKIITDFKDNLRERDLVFAGIRPEEIAIIRPERPISEKIKDNIFEGKIVAIHRLQASYLLTLKINGLDQIIEINVTPCAFRDMDIVLGKTLEVSLKKESIWVLRKAN